MQYITDHSTSIWLDNRQDITEDYITDNISHVAQNDTSLKSNKSNGYV